MSDCKKFKDLINLYIDNEINEADKKELLSHLERCNDCKKDFLIY